MNDEAFARAMEMVAMECASNPLSHWYLSYAGEDGFRGAVFLQAPGPASAVLIANIEKLSPGGEVMIVAVPPEHIPEPKFWNRLLTKEEIQEASGQECKTIREWEAEDEK